MQVLVALLFLISIVGAAPPAQELVIVYDNTSATTGVQADWGFAAVVDFAGRRILFDTGTRPGPLLDNLGTLKIDAGSIEEVFISHAHGDHLGGLFGLRQQNSALVVHFLDVFPASVFRAAEAAGMKPSRVTEPIELAPRIYSTGVVEGLPPEQSLILETSGGIVLLTGCSHPGLVKIVEAVESQRKKDSIRLVVGGFHMINQDEATIRHSIARLKALNVLEIIPTHCTGEPATRLFREAYGERCRTGGVGTRIALN